MENLSEADKLMLAMTPNPLNQDPVDPVDPVDPIDPVDPVDPVDPIDPSDPVEPADPVEPDPVDPVDPVDPEPVDNDPIVIEDWDLDPVDPVEPTDPVIDYSVLSQEIGIEASTKEDLVSKLNAIKDENNRLKQDLVDKPVEALNQVDYDKYSPKEFFVEASKELFTDDKGAVDTEALNTFIEDQDPNMVNMQGNMIKKQYVQAQEDQNAREQVLAEQKRQMADTSLKSAIKEFDTFNGFKVKDNHKDQLYNDISTGKAMQEMFYTKDGDYDMSKVVKAYFYYKNGEKLEAYRAQRANTTATRNILDSSTNADLNNNGTLATPNTPAGKETAFEAFAKELGMPLPTDK